MFKAPDGTPIKGVAQVAKSVWSTYWSASHMRQPDAYIFTVDGPSADWDSVAYDEQEVLVDESGEEWLAHHLIGEDDAPLRTLAVGSAMNEVAALKRAALFDQIRDASAKGSPMWNLADSNAAGERLVAKAMREQFDHAKAVDRDPDPDQWPGGALTGHPDYLPEGGDAIVSTFVEGGARADCLTDLVLLGMSQAAAEKALEEARPRRQHRFTADSCPSRHWNDGADYCSDCGEHLA